MNNLIQQLHQAVCDAVSGGWSINMLAKEAGVSRASVQEWYSGAQESISLQTATGLAAFFGMRFTKPKIPKPPHASGDVRGQRRKPTAKGTTPKPKRKKA